MAKVWLASAAIVLLGLAAYGNSFDGVFVFDDAPSIVENPTIRDLSKLGTVLSPPADGRTVQGRPVFNLSLALNYAHHGASPSGYHVVNFVIHALCGLVLFGVVRRTLLLPGIPQPLALRSTGVAFVTAATWVLHPLCTAAVTYVIQRCEALMALFYLLTLYCVIRGATGSVLWRPVAVVACALGMATKEVMVTAPVVVLLFDRAFLTGSFRRTLAERWGTYAGLAATWGLLAWLMLRSGDRGGTMGFGGDITWFTYAQTQAVAVLTYLRLALFPYPLVFEYGAEVVTDPLKVWPCAALLAVLVGASARLIWRRPRLGFAALAFFLILAPTSSVVPVVSQTIGEHRAYLPLAALTTFVVTGLVLWKARPKQEPRQTSILPWIAAVGLLAVLGWLTHFRNSIYRSELLLWQDTVLSRPENPRGHNNLGSTLMLMGKPGDALPCFSDALQLKPDFVEALNSMGACMNRLRMPREAIGYLEKALRLRPDHAGAHLNLGDSLADLRRVQEAISHYEESIRLKPESPKAWLNLGILLAGEGRQTEAIARFREALRVKPDYALAHYNLAISLAKNGENAEAQSHFEEAERLGLRPR